MENKQEELLKTKEKTPTVWISWTWKVDWEDKVANWFKKLLKSKEDV
jgi:hypothetical protein